jgi:hypothetical protein
MPKEKQQKKKGPSLRHAPLGEEVETKKQQKIPASSTRQQDDDDNMDSSDMVDESNLPQNLGAQIFNQAREQRQEMSVMETSAKQSAIGNDDDSDYDVSSNMIFRNIHLLLMQVLTQWNTSIFIG